MKSSRKYIGISIKHTDNRWKYGMPCVLWGYKVTEDDEPRCMSGYTKYLSEAERYEKKDLQEQYGDSIKEEPVKMSPDLCKQNRRYDSVIVEYKEYKKYCEMFLIAQNRP